LRIDDDWLTALSVWWIW